MSKMGNRSTIIYKNKVYKEVLPWNQQVTVCEKDRWMSKSATTPKIRISVNKIK